jgi:hypothetical protein
MVTLDADGEKLPSDWYLRLAREAQKQLRAAAAPPLDRPAAVQRRPQP